MPGCGPAAHCRARTPAPCNAAINACRSLPVVPTTVVNDEQLREDGVSLTIKRMINKATGPHLITLHPFTREDFLRLISWLPTEADLVEWCAAFFRYPLTDAQLERYLESAKQPNSRVIFTARSIGGEGVGHIEISQIWPHLSTRLSRILVAPDQRRRGIASSMVGQALMVSFEQYFADRVDLGVSAANLAAIGCYAKLGFRRVGTWSNAIPTGAASVDVVWMTVTRDTWAGSGQAP
jgi:RimJ/RimL family protein N-acetyltransferase